MRSLRDARPSGLHRLSLSAAVAFSLAHPGLGPRRVSDELARPRWGGIIVSPSGVWRCLRRHGLSTRAKRLGLVAGYRTPYEPPRETDPEPHIEVSRPGELVGIARGKTYRHADTEREKERGALGASRRKQATCRDPAQADLTLPVTHV